MEVSNNFGTHSIIYPKLNESKMVNGGEMEKIEESHLVNKS